MLLIYLYSLSLEKKRWTITSIPLQVVFDNYKIFAVSLTLQQRQQQIWLLGLAPRQSRRSFKEIYNSIIKRIYPHSPKEAVIAQIKYLFINFKFYYCYGHLFYADTLDGTNKYQLLFNTHNKFIFIPSTYPSLSLSMNALVHT